MVLINTTYRRFHTLPEWSGTTTSSTVPNQFTRLFLHYDQDLTQEPSTPLTVSQCGMLATALLEYPRRFQGIIHYDAHILLRNRNIYRFLLYASNTQMQNFLEQGLVINFAQYAVTDEGTLEINLYLDYIF